MPPPHGVSPRLSGPGVPVRGPGGPLVQSRGRAVRLAAAARQRLRAGPLVPAGVALRAGEGRPPPGAGQGPAGGGLACTLPSVDYSYYNSE